MYEFVVLDFDGPILHLFNKEDGFHATERLVELGRKFGIENNSVSRTHLFIDTWSKMRNLVETSGGDTRLFDSMVHTDLAKLETRLLESKSAPEDSRRMIDALCKTTKRLGILSNNSEGAIRRWTETHGLACSFDAIHGRSSDEPYQRLKPNPLLLIMMAAHWGCELSEIVFIGDTITDYECAEAAGTHFLAYGSGTFEPGAVRRLLSRHDVIRYFQY